MKFKRKCQVPHVGGITPDTSTCWDPTSWKAALQKRLLGSLVDKQLTVSQQCAFVAKDDTKHLGVENTCYCLVHCVV